MANNEHIEDKALHSADQPEKRVNDRLTELQLLNQELLAEIMRCQQAEDALKLTNAQLREASLRDVLTGLYNRRFLEDALRREVVRARRHHRPLGIMLADIDHFKKVNDTFGHAAGDAVLKAVSEYLVSVVRREDVVCRYGGEEFVILMPDTPIDVARQRAERLRERARHVSISHDGTRIGPVTISIGVAIFPENAENEHALLQSADEALYRAKRGGRDRVEISAAVSVNGRQESDPNNLGKQPAQSIKILVVEDNPDDADLLLHELRRASIAFDSLRVDTEADFIQGIDEFDPDVILSDYSLPGFDGMSALSIARTKCAEVPFIFVSGTIGEERAIESFKRGATDYVLKTNLGRLSPIVRRALEEARERAGRKKAELELLQQEEKISRLHRINTVSSGINAIIVRVRDRQELFRQACRIAVEQGQFRMAWIGLATSSTTKVKPMAWMGFEGGYLDEVELSLRNVTEDHGAAGQALRSKSLVVANDIESDSRVVFKAEALSRGYRSLVALPLLVEDEVVAVMVLYASQRDFFDDQELALLSDLAEDISFALDHIEKEEKLNYLSYYDALTGLPNRTLFRDRLSQLVQTAPSDGSSSVAVLLIDLERFRSVNDTLGRPAGDELLKFMAQRLGEVMDDMIGPARIGGDYFAIALPNVKDEAAVAQIVEQRILAPLARPLMIADVELRIQPKLGIALFPIDGPDADTLIMNADAALKKAKEGGEKHLFYVPQIHTRIAERLTLENRLRRALEEEQFVLHYQPKVDLNSNHITGLEALIRWQSPELGLVMPNTFIPLLEETNLILEVGRWVLRKAVADYQALLLKGLQPPRIAVNVSALQLRHKGFVGDVMDVIKKGGGSTGLDLEVTESLLMEDMEGTIVKLNKLKEMGVRIALDDFGTGFSSLSYLVRLPIDFLKIDQTFIANMSNNPGNIAIVSAVISLAHSLKLKVVAEGAETQEEVNLLRQLKCDEMQGYVFSRPISLQQIEVMLNGRLQ